MCLAEATSWKPQKVSEVALHEVQNANRLRAIYHQYFMKRIRRIIPNILRRHSMADGRNSSVGRDSV